MRSLSPVGIEEAFDGEVAAAEHVSTGPHPESVGPRRARPLTRNLIPPHPPGRHGQGGTQPAPLRQPHTPLQVLDPFLLVPGLTFGRHVGHFQFLGNRFRVPSRGNQPGMTRKSGNRESPGPSGPRQSRQLGL